MALQIPFAKTQQDDQTPRALGAASTRTKLGGAEFR